MKTKKGDKQERHKSKKRTSSRKSPSHEKNYSEEESFSESELDLSVNLQPISDFVKNRPKMVEEMFSTVKGSQLKAMLPDVLKKIDEEELKHLCLEELEVMSKKRISCILNGQEMTSSSESEEESEEETPQVDQRKSPLASSSAVEPELPDSTTNPVDKSVSPTAAVAEVLVEIDNENIVEEIAISDAVESSSPVEQPTKPSGHSQEIVVSQRLSILTEADVHEVVPDEGTDSPSLPRNDSCGSFGQPRQLRRFRPDTEKSNDEEAIDLGLEDSEDGSVAESQSVVETDVQQVQMEPQQSTDDPVNIERKSSAGSSAASVQSSNGQSSRPESPSSYGNSHRDRKLSEDLRVGKTTKNRWRHDRYGDVNYAPRKRSRLSPREHREQDKIAARYGHHSKEEKSWRWEHDDRTPVEEENSSQWDKSDIPRRHSAEQSRSHRHPTSPQGKSERQSTNERGRKRRHSDKVNKNVSDEEVEVEVEGSDLEEGEIRMVKVAKRNSESSATAGVDQTKFSSTEEVGIDRKLSSPTDGNSSAVTLLAEAFRSLTPQSPLVHQSGFVASVTPSSPVTQEARVDDVEDSTKAEDVRLEPTSPLLQDVSSNDQPTPSGVPNSNSLDNSSSSGRQSRDGCWSAADVVNVGTGEDQSRSPRNDLDDRLYQSDLDSSEDEGESHSFDPPPPGMELPSHTGRVDQYRSGSSKDIAGVSCSKSETPRTSILSMRKVYEQLKRQKKLQEKRQSDKAKVYGAATYQKKVEAEPTALGPSLPPTLSETVVVAAESTTGEPPESSKSDATEKPRKKSVVSPEFLAKMRLEQEKYQQERRVKMIQFEELKAKRQKIAQNERDAMKLTIKSASLQVCDEPVLLPLQKNVKSEERRHKRRRSRSPVRNSSRPREQSAPNPNYMSTSREKSNSLAPPVAKEVTITRDQLKQKLENLERSIERAEANGRYQGHNSQLEGLKNQAAKLRKSLDLGQSGSKSSVRGAGVVEDSVEDQVKRKRQELELIELELRARAIRALMKRKEEEERIVD